MGLEQASDLEKASTVQIAKSNEIFGTNEVSEGRAAGFEPIEDTTSEECTSGNHLKVQRETNYIRQHWQRHKSKWMSGILIILFMAMTVVLVGSIICGFVNCKTREMKNQSKPASVAIIWIPKSGSAENLQPLRFVKSGILFKESMVGPSSSQGSVSAAETIAGK